MDFSDGPSCVQTVVDTGCAAFVERSTYVLFASAALLLVWQWQPIMTLIWKVNNPVGSAF